MKLESYEQRILTAEEGKLLYNGETAAKTVYLGRDADLSDWQEIPEEEYQTAEVKT